MIDYSRFISENARVIAPSGIRKFFDLLEEMKDAISLGVGEPDYVTPWHVRDAGIYSLEKGHTKYTPNSGMKALRDEISKTMLRRFSLNYSPRDEILVTVGGSEAIDLAVRAVINPGDEVIIPQPSFVCYGPITTLAGGVSVPVRTREEDLFKLTPELLSQAVTPKTKALILPYPNNPTGGIMNRGELEAIRQIILDNDLFVISDEIYAELTYGQKHVSIANLEGMAERTLVVQGFSKSYAMTGWRLGYACGPAPIIHQMMKIHQYAIMCAPTTSQYAAIEALRSGDEDIEEMRRDYDRRRRFVIDSFNSLGLTTFEGQGAFYVFPCIRSTGLSSEEFCERLLIEEKVAVVPGNAFGECGEGYVRACYATSISQLKEAFARIGSFLERRKNG